MLGGWQQAVWGTGASDVDADGKCQAFCLLVLGTERDFSIQMLFRGETPTSVGKKMES